MQHFFFHPVLASWDTGVIAVVGAYCIPIFIVGLSFIFRYRRRKLMHETLRLLIEKGQPIPPGLLNEPWQSEAWKGYQPARRNDLRRGLIWAAIGLALLLGDASLGGLPGTGFHVSRIGLIPLFIGVAFIICWMVEGRGRNSNGPTNSNPSGPTPG